MFFEIFKSQSRYESLYYLKPFDAGSLLSFKINHSRYDFVLMGLLGITKTDIIWCLTILNS